MKAELYSVNNGELLTYDALHSRLRRENGKAKLCCFCKTKEKKRFEWALIKGRKYSLDINDYIQLCVPCHRKYDFTEETSRKMSKTRRCKKPNNIRPVVLNGKLEFETMLEASIELGISIGSIHNNINGLSKTTKLGKWEYKKN